MRHGEGDDYSEEWTLAVLKLVRGRFEEVLGLPPGGPQNWDGDRETRRAIDFLVGKGAKEVASILDSGSAKGYRGMTYGYAEDENGRGWSESRPLSKWEHADGSSALESAGIKVREFDAATETFLDEMPPAPVPEGPRHVLEGRFGVFTHGTSGWIRDGKVAMLGRFVHDEFEEIVSVRYDDPANWHESPKDRAEKILAALAEHGAKEVVTVRLDRLPEGEFLGVSTRRHSWPKDLSEEDRAEYAQMHADEPEKLKRALADHWIEKCALDPRDEVAKNLRAAGVAIKEFDPSTGEFSDGTAG